MNKLKSLKRDLKKVSSKKRALLMQSFFKTGKGEYGEGDIFIGATVPDIRKTARKYSNMSFNEVVSLLQSKLHEERLAALLMLVNKFECGDQKEKEKIYNFYIKNTKYINNWDLVDLSAHKIVGAYLTNKSKAILLKLSKSDYIWERRIAVISTFNFINRGDLKYSFIIAERLLKDKHDLIHKAVGWMLREAGKRSQKREEKFLKKHYKHMPRTMLRYAIERFPERKRHAYLKGLI